MSNPTTSEGVKHFQQRIQIVHQLIIKINQRINSFRNSMLNCKFIWIMIFCPIKYLNRSMQIRKKILPNNFTFPNCQYVIIDTDAGGDDTQAILLAVSQAKRTGKTILGITCIDGNCSLDDVANNVLIALLTADYPIPVYKGSRMGLTSINHKDYYFSKDGFGMKQREYIDKLKAQNKWRKDLIHEDGTLQFLIQSANKYQGNLAIIAIGPLTNLALAYHIDNSFPSKVPLLSLMGGSISALGIRQFFAAEFNFYLDAEAAKIVTEVFPLVCINSFDLAFDIGTRKTLPLFTQKARPKAKLISDVYQVILSTHRPVVCDPLACIPVFTPELVKSIYQAYGQVVIEGVRTRGLLALDWFKQDPQPGRSKIWAVAEIDLNGVMDRISNSYN